MVNLLFQAFALSSFYLAFYFLGQSTTSGSNDPFYGIGDELFQVANSESGFAGRRCTMGNETAMNLG
jgi:hypothetical protein